MFIRYDKSVANEPKAVTINKLVTAELFKVLSHQSPQTLILGTIAAAILFASLRDYIDEKIAYSWFISYVLVTIIRLVHFYYIKEKDSLSIQKHLNFFVFGGLISGCIWASLIFIYDPTFPLTLQLFIIVILFGMPVGSLVINSVYFPLFLAFSSPQIFALIYWAIFLSPGLSFGFSFIAITYATLVNITAYKLNKHLIESLTSKLYNQALTKEVHEINKELAEIAYVDSLTNIHNRRYFIENMTEFLKTASEKHKQNTVFLLFDLDKFKQVNDTLGHQAGDTYLIEFANRLKGFEKLHKNVISARLGGDEFILSYQLKNRNDIEKDIKTLLSLLLQPIKFKETIIQPGLSIGVSQYSIHAKDVSTLLNLADKAMYKAKSHGGNTYYFYDNLLNKVD